MTAVPLSTPDIGFINFAVKAKSWIFASFRGVKFKYTPSGEKLK
ncbi:hypothetical protein ADU37_CDS15430 [Thermococcus sp. 2319x1]|nr:hypothetical protein ADU37_CDS15430 [Thermococcus sp. 2319x1]